MNKMQTSLPPLIRNAFFNGVGHLALTGISLIITPVILHRLGDEGFGVWVVASSIMAFSTIVSVGLPNSMIRYISYYNALRDTRQLNETVNSALALLVPLSLLVFILSLFLSTVFPQLINLSPGLQRQASFSLIFVGTDFALGLVRSGTTGFIFSLERILIYRLMAIAAALLRATLIYYLVRPRDLMTLTLINLLCTALELLLSVFVIRRLCPATRLGLRYIKAGKLRQLLNYGSFMLLMTVGYMLVVYTGTIMVGTLLSVVLVATYSVALRIIELGRSTVEQATQVIIPRFSALSSRHPPQELRQSCLLGTKCCFAFSLVFMICLIGLGEPFVACWIGREYAGPSWWLLVTLGAGHIFSMTANAGCAMLIGIGRHRLISILVASEGVVNLILTLLLVRVGGIYGVALGTTVPLVVTNSYILTHVFKKEFGLTFGTLLRNALLPAAVVGISLAASLHLNSRWLQLTSIFHVAASCGLGLIVCTAVFWFFTLNDQERYWIRRNIQLLRAD
jgi:O-antigen/teichoic acid export membrane protein